MLHGQFKLPFSHIETGALSFRFKLSYSQIEMGANSSFYSFLSSAQGNEGELGPGWVQWMTAGSGALTRRHKR